MAKDNGHLNQGYQPEVDIELNSIGVKNEKQDSQNDSKADPFDAVDDFRPSGEPWSGLDGKAKLKRVLFTTTKVVLLIGMLYLFICSLSFLGSAFQLLGGKAAGEAFSSKNLISNPIAGLMIGVLATVILQSSSTTTSIVVAMVSSEILKVEPAIYIIMGANIGTSVTNTIVAIGQINDKNQFRRAFAAATVHDMFNILCVVVLLPIEVISGYLFHLTKKIMESMNLKSGDSSYKKELLKKVTKPFTNLIIQLDKKILTKLATGDKSADGKSLIKFWCDKGKDVLKSELVTKEVNASVTVNTTGITQYVIRNMTVWENVTVTEHTEKCKFLLHDTGLSDAAVGAIMLIIALAILCTCLVLIVKTLHSLLRGQVATVIKKTFNSNFPKPFGFLTGYVAILVGAGMTILVQSSSIFTSALTPLVGLGVMSLQKIFPLTLGANIGTTCTGILAALASSKLHLSLQIAFCHLFFNITGIIIWYPIPFMRNIPINLAKKLGNTTAEYRWFAVLYLITVFFLLPGTIFALSLAGWKVFAGVLIPIVVLLIFIIIVNILQSRQSRLLPNKLQTWEFLPMPLHSLEPYDKFVSSVYKKVKKRDNATISE